MKNLWWKTSNKYFRSYQTKMRQSLEIEQIMPIFFDNRKLLCVPKNSFSEKRISFNSLAMSSLNFRWSFNENAKRNGYGFSVWLDSRSGIGSWLIPLVFCSLLVIIFEIFSICFSSPSTCVVWFVKPIEFQLQVF